MCFAFKCAEFTLNKHSTGSLLQPKNKAQYYDDLTFTTNNLSKL